MRQRRPVDDDHSTHMSYRRVALPNLFTPNGSYKNWLHCFTIQRDRSGASVNQETHFTLPWELEDTELNPETYQVLKAHWNIHGFADWNPTWRKYWGTIYSYFQPSGGPTDKMFWVILPEPGIQHLSRLVADEKRAWMIACKREQGQAVQISKEKVEDLLAKYQITVDLPSGE